MAAIVVYALLLIALTPPLGQYMYRVYTRERIGRAEGLVYRLIGVNPGVQQTWRRYGTAVVWFSGISMVLIYALMRAIDTREAERLSRTCRKIREGDAVRLIKELMMEDSE